jgi:hypothetical protein
VQLVFLVVVLWVIPFFVAYRIAFEKNRFGLLYGFFGWIGVVAVALLPPVYYGGSEKTCPDCAEHVLVDATSPVDNLVCVRPRPGTSVRKQNRSMAPTLNRQPRSRR